MSYEWHDVIGNLGVFAILATYLALQMQRLDPRRVTYSALNALGALFITVSLVFDFNLSAFVVEVVWVMVSIYGIVRALRLRAVTDP
ncbi:MAG: hypothetical protein HC809_05770 [Gammaproteobacteria bacterium]|nr:hypothetical protein [Gammaproteobacteria bacterium]